jgi:alpha/beta superfamily hydrolase
MNIPKLPVDTRPFLWGAAAGAAALAFVGFNFGGWVTDSASEKIAVGRATAATLSALTPVCVAQFKTSTNATANLAALKKTDAWQRGEYVSKGGWATLPGSTAEPNSAVASACAEALIVS